MKTIKLFLTLILFVVKFVVVMSGFGHEITQICSGIARAYNSLPTPKVPSFIAKRSYDEKIFVASTIVCAAASVGYYCVNNNIVAFAILSVVCVFYTTLLTSGMKLTRQADSQQ